jgi:hypothetical protein
MCSPNGTSPQSSSRKQLNQTSDFSQIDGDGKLLIENNPQDYALNSPTSFGDLNDSTRFLADDGLKNGQIVDQTRTFNDPLRIFFNNTKNNFKDKTGGFVRDTAINAAKFGGKTVGTTAGLVLTPQSDEEFLGLLRGGIGGGALGTLLPVPGGFATGATIGGGIGANAGANFAKSLK